jgi:membrane protein YqaA with SNARE-associated domain
VNIPKLAPYLLALISFLNGCCLPLAPDFIFVPLMLASRHKTKKYFISIIVFVTLGSLCGYLLGNYFFNEYVYTLITKFGYLSELERCLQLLGKYGVVVLLLSAFIPLPYMIFPLVFGGLQLPVIPFIICCMISRMVRYGLVILIVRAGNKSILALIKSSYLAKRLR